MMGGRVMMVGVAAALLLCGCEHPVRAETPPEAITDFVLHELNGFYLNRDDPTDRPPIITVVPDGVIRPVNVSHDGVTDWLIAWPDSAQFCGTGGCMRTLYVSGGPKTDRGAEGGGESAGFIRVFDRQAFDLAIREIDGETQLEVWVHHLNCPSERDECRFAWTWDGERRELRERPASDGATVIEGAPLSVVDLGEQDGLPRLPDTLPQAAYDAWAASRAACVVAGAETGVVLTASEIHSTPDLNGDGRRDWLQYPAWACDSSGPAWSYRLWVTDGDGVESAAGVAHLAFEGASEHAVAFDIGNARTVVLDVADAAAEAPARAPLRYDAASGRLVARP